MCGIAGIANLKRDIRNETNIIEKMTETLKMRGPDEDGLYVTQNALLGHRRLVVVDPRGGSQPMIKEHQFNKYVVVYNGELYNTEELRAELKDIGYNFKSYSDTEVLLTSYIEWGEECPEHFNGIFAFAIWDESKKKLFLARDPLGVKPLFYAIRNGSLIFGSEIKALLAHPSVEPVIDREGLCQVFGLGPGRSLGSGIFKDVFEVKPAESIVYNIDGVRKKEYWYLKAKPHLESLDETIEHMRYLVIDAIKRQLYADVPVCTFLSGGLDSSAISSVAAKEFNNLGKATLDTYSIDYKDNEKYFKSNDFEPDPDREWIGKMVEYAKSHHNNILIDNLELAKALTSSVMACDLPGMADVDSSLYLFCKEVKKGATVALSGECADEIFGGYPWYYREDSVNADTFPWSQSVGSRRLILSKEFKTLPLEEYVKSKYEESLSAVPHLEGESKKEYRMREMFYLNIKWFMITLLNRKDRMSMSNSLEVRVPYADYRIVEYAFNVPWSMKYAYDREKGLLRAALHDILPEDVLWRKKSPYPKTHNPEYTDIVCSWMTDILGDKNSPILDIIDVDYVKELVKTGGTSYGKPWFGQLMRGPQLVAYLIQVNTWLKKYKIQIQ